MELYDDDLRHLNHSLAYCEHICRPSPGWQTRRAWAMIRAGGTCEVCWAATATQVHHVTYQRLGREDINEDLLAVCRPCHDGITHRPNAPASGKPGKATWAQLQQLALSFNRHPQFNPLLDIAEP